MNVWYYEKNSITSCWPINGLLLVFTCKSGLVSESLCEGVCEETLKG